jgi:hypothetical protein
MKAQAFESAQNGSGVWQRGLGEALPLATQV